MLSAGRGGTDSRVRNSRPFPVAGWLCGSACRAGGSGGLGERLFLLRAVKRVRLIGVSVRVPGVVVEENDIGTSLW